MEAQYDEKHGWVRYDPEAERVVQSSEVTPISNAMHKSKHRREG